MTVMTVTTVLTVQTFSSFSEEEEKSHHGRHVTTTGGAAAKNDPVTKPLTGFYLRLRAGCAPDDKERATSSTGLTTRDGDGRRTVVSPEPEVEPRQNTFRRSPLGAGDRTPSARADVADTVRTECSNCSTGAMTVGGFARRLARPGPQGGGA